MFRSKDWSVGFFRQVTAHPYLVLAAASIVVIVSAMGLTRLVKDTSVKAFIPPGHESLVADSKATLNALRGVLGLGPTDIEAAGE